jgi:hypothetical protein
LNGAQLLDAGEELAVERALIAGQQSERGLAFIGAEEAGGKGGERILRQCGGFVLRRGEEGGKNAGLQLFEAAKLPLRVGDLLDQRFFGCADGLVIVAEAIERVVVLVLILERKDGERGSEAVTQAVVA